MSDAPRKRGFGCLGVFSIICLTFFTAVETAVLFRLNPDWFDRIAFWRGPILEPELVLSSDPAARSSFESIDAEAIRQLQPVAVPGKLTLLELATVVGDYEPATGLTLTNPAGAEFQIPAGALGERAQVAMTPVVEVPTVMIAELAGPVYEIRVGNAEHTNFQQAATISLPVLPDKAKGATLALWDGQRWQELPSTVDAVGNRIRANVPHLSLIGVLMKPLSGRVIAALGGTGATLITYVATSPTIRAGVRSAAWWAEGLPKLETQNFVVHYYPNESWIKAHPTLRLPNPRGPAPPMTIPPPPPISEHAVIEDSKYALARGRKAGEHPLFVQDVAEWLEQARAKLEAIGVPLRKPAAIRYAVFLISMKDYGDTNMGGPVFISTRIPEFAERDKFSVEAAPRSTIAHELVHVAQESWFRMDQGWRWRWWMESTAAYLGDRCWEPDFAPDTVRRGYLMTNGILANRLPASPMDMAKDTDYYAYATFFSWLDRAHAGAGLKLVQKANDGGDATIAGLDRFAREVAGVGLDSLWTEFAMDFYHRDIWRGEITPGVHRGATPHSQLLGQTYRTDAGDKDIPDIPFSYVTRGSTRTDWALTPIRRMPHLSVQAMYVRAEQLQPAIRKGKLVIAVEPQNDGPAPQEYVAAAQLNVKSLPATGDPGTFVEITGDKRCLVIDDFAVNRGKNNATILVANRSLTEMSGAVLLRRWLLLAPTFADFQREEPVGGLHSRHWTVTWHRTELKDFPEAFKGYNVYRRKWGEPDSAFVRVKTEHPDEIITDHAPDDEDYAYMVRVVDALGNESADSPVEKYDPFQGLWDGEIKLIDGSLVEPLIAVFKKAGEEEEQKELASIAKIVDPAERARRQRQWEETKRNVKSIFDDVVKLLRTFEQFARVGIPMQMKIRRTKGEYYLSFPEVCWQATGWKESDDIALTREGQYMLKIKKMPEGLADLFLRLHRKDEIRGEYTIDKSENGQRLYCKVKWNFERKSK